MKLDVSRATPGTMFSDGIANKLVLLRVISGQEWNDCVDTHEQDPDTQIVLFSTTGIPEPGPQLDAIRRRFGDNVHAAYYASILDIWKVIGHIGDGSESDNVAVSV